MQKGIITSVRISNLFGRFTYDIPSDGAIRSPAIFYGDNGTGKSTILKLIFHLLSSAPDKDHRNSIRVIPFDYFSVELSNGFKLTAERPKKEAMAEILLRIFNDEKLVAEWLSVGSKSPSNFEFDVEAIAELRRRGVKPNDFDLESLVKYSLQHNQSHNPGTKYGQKEYLSILADCTPEIFYLNADRKFESDSVVDPSDEIELRRLINQREFKSVTDILQASRSISLKQALVNASKWITRRAVKSANQGSENVHSAYEEVVRRLSVDYNDFDGTIDNTFLKEIADLKEIEERTERYSRYELAAPLKMDEFIKALSGSREGRSVSARVVTPYIQSLQGRLLAIEPTFNVLDSFVSTVNGFLSRKSLCFTLTQGFHIISDNEVQLEANQLSSGEQQLLLIFSYVLTARDKPSVFIIDEPEISLNIKWQRTLVSALKRVAGDSSVQFVFASHSLEFISQHRESVIALASK